MIISFCSLRKRMIQMLERLRTVSHISQLYEIYAQLL